MLGHPFRSKLNESSRLFLPAKHFTMNTDKKFMVRKANKVKAIKEIIQD